MTTQSDSVAVAVVPVVDTKAQAASSKRIGEKITRLATAGTKYNNAIIETTMDCIVHFLEYKDRRLLGRLLGGNVENGKIIKAHCLGAGGNYGAVRFWVAKFTPFTWTKEGELRIPKNWTPDQFQLDEMVATPFWALAEVKAQLQQVKPFTSDSLFAMIKSARTRLEKAIKEGDSDALAIDPALARSALDSAERAIRRTLRAPTTDPVPNAA